MKNLDQILTGLQAANEAGPLIVGLIAMVRKTGDTRSDDEITAEALSIAGETSTITSQDMVDG